MNMNQIINMIFRLFIRKAVNHGIKAGVNQFSKRGEQDDEPQQKQPGHNAKRTKQAMKVGRRVARF